MSRTSSAQTRVRTTVRLENHLMRQAKKYAAEQGTTLTHLLETALREKLARNRDRRGDLESRPLPTFSGNGLQAGVDLYDSAGLLDLMDRAGS